MRKLTEHKVNRVNDLLDVTVTDEPHEKSFANHSYKVVCHDRGWLINFQDGPINEVGVNGLTHEVLLSIVADRLRGFQSGPYKCKENACALTHIEEALHWLQSRTLDRMRRGIEGTHVI